MLKVGKVLSVLLCIILILSFAVLSVPNNAYAGGSIDNGGFESGNFTGWNVIVPVLGTAQVVTRFENPVTHTSYTAKEGSYFALLQNGSHLAYTAVSQNFAVSNGSVISGWAFFNTVDYLPWNDEGRVEITLINNQTGMAVATLFSASVSTVGDFGGTPWTSWSYAFPGPGQYTIQAKVINFADDAVSSYIGLDGVSLMHTKKLFEDDSSSSSTATQSWAKTAETKILTASVQPSQVVAGQPVKIMANAANRGDADGSLTASLTINGRLEDSKQLIISGNTGRPIEFTVIKDKPGIYTVDVNGQQAYFTVIASSEESSNKIIVFTVLGVMALLTIMLGIAVARKRFANNG